MASTTSASTRRVLSDLNVNAALASKAVSTPVKTSGGKLFGEVMMAKGENTVTVVGLAEGKRAVHEGEEGQSASSKRRKISVSDARGFLSPSPQSPPSISPASSFVNNEINDSQNTIFTNPDDFAYHSPSQPQSSPLTPTQLRSKARAIRLRLSLASYKVRTNQIDVPIARLEIRSSQSLPQLRRAASNTSNRGISLSTARRTALPDKPAAEISSSPPSGRGEMGGNVRMGSYGMGNVDGNRSAPVSPRKGINEREGFSTPILSRQRMGLLNPPFLGDMDGERDLTSSVVKGRAAVDGLLSLHRMAN